METPSARQVTFQAPATVGNFGPGLDVLSLAIAGEGDRITLEVAEADRITVTGPDADAIPTAWTENVAGAAIDHLRATTGIDARFHLRLQKPRPSCSGLGSSASSSAGAALAFHAHHADLDLSPGALHAAAVAGEAITGGNADDVASVILGGLAVIPEGLPMQRVQPPADLHLAVVAPDLRLPTAEMRALLPDAYPRADALWNMGRVAGVVAACAAGDVAALGACLDDRLQVPYRKAKLPHLDACIRAARDAGAHGACLSGSGPAVIAVCDEAAVATEAAAAMADACRSLPSLSIEAEGFAALPEFRVMHDAVLMR